MSGVVCFNGRVAIDVFGFPNFKHPEVFILSHVHDDHIRGLRNSWSLGPIYCSEITGQLLRLKFKLHDIVLRPLSFETNCNVCLSDGTTFSLRLVDAHHCPGSAMVIINKLNDGKCDDNERILYTGDFRFEDSLLEQLNLSKVFGCIAFQSVYIDDTYISKPLTGNIQCFPSRSEALSQAINWLETQKKDIDNKQNISRREYRFTMKNDLKPNAWLQTISWSKNNARKCDNRSRLLLLSGRLCFAAKQSADFQHKSILYSDHCSPDELYTFIEHIRFDKVFTLTGKDVNPHLLKIKLRGTMKILENRDNKSLNYLNTSSDTRRSPVFTLDNVSHQYGDNDVRPSQNCKYPFISTNYLWQSTQRCKVLNLQQIVDHKGAFSVNAPEIVEDYICKYLDL
ncbi:hypothetical protein GJ496_005888 [Pomphorhynchus laevis]|nr:hypothetical protein GJ496_005888 [Pomphorhynchus laevis]